MHYLVFYITVILLIQNARSYKSKLYAIDLSNNADEIELSELQKLITKSKEKLVHVNLGKDSATSYKDCINDQTTYLDKINCLLNLQRKKSIDKTRLAEHREFYDQRPKRKITALFNYGREVRYKPFTDISRQTFSQDYLDIRDLSRQDPKCSHSNCQDRNNIDDYIIKDRYDIKRRNIKDSDESETDDDTSSSSEDDDSNSSEDITRTYKKRKPKRFQVVFNEDSSIESDGDEISSESDSNSASEEVTEKPKKSRKKEAYLQGNKIFKNIRRRLEHFLPKRYHWDEADMQNLGYYWYDGSRGKYT